jgi:hypothetical protein
MTDFTGLTVFKNAANGDAGAEREPAPSHLPAEYLRARERAERAAAKRAQSLAARHVHQELAQHYARLVSSAG